MPAKRLRALSAMGQLFWTLSGGSEPTAVTGQIPTTVRPGGAVATSARGKLGTTVRPGGVDTTAREV